MVGAGVLAARVAATQSQGASRACRASPSGWVGVTTGPHVPLPVPCEGIAYDAKGGRLFVTGKMWPKIFEIKVQPGKLGVTLASARRMCIKQGSL
jgi:glutaminyl-peptide cyclotransferase